MAGLDAGVALDDWIDGVEALAEVARYDDLATTEADQERLRCVFQAEGAVQSSHDDPFFSSSVGQVATEYHNHCINLQVLYKNPVRMSDVVFSQKDRCPTR